MREGQSFSCFSSSLCQWRDMLKRSPEHLTGAQESTRINQRSKGQNNIKTKIQFQANDTIFLFHRPFEPSNTIYSISLHFIIVDAPSCRSIDTLPAHNTIHSLLPFKRLSLFLLPSLSNLAIRDSTPQRPRQLLHRSLTFIWRKRRGGDQVFDDVFIRFEELYGAVTGH